MMGLIILSVIIVIIVILVIVRILWKWILTRYLYSQYLFFNDDRVKTEINKEYLLKVEHDFDQNVYDDLELEEVFHVINHTQSDIGKEYMFGRMFMNPSHHQELERLIHIFEDEKTLKSSLHILYELNKGYSEGLNIFDKIKAFDVIDYIAVASIYILFIIALVAGMTQNFQLCVQLIFLWFFLAGMYHMHIIKKYDEILGMVTSYCYVIDAIDKLCHLHLFSDEHKLRKTTKMAKKYTLITHFFVRISSIDVIYLFDFIKNIFMFHLLQAFILFKNKDKLKENYLYLYECIGLVDMALTVKKIRSQYTSCIPTLGQDLKVECQEVYHPLIKDPVKNTFTTHESCMITGSNASGKSTFMKTIGVNMILARAIHTCFADAFYFSNHAICTSIHMKDDLLSHESYYVKEIKTLKKIIERVHREDCYVFIDEILRGTNERERIEISRVIIQDLFEHHSVTFITTHDLKIVDYFLDTPQYCFLDEVKNHQLYCDYKIKKGICRVGNAIKLLEVYDYDPELLAKIKSEVIYK